MWYIFFIMTSLIWVNNIIYLYSIYSRIHSYIHICNCKYYKYLHDIILLTFKFNVTFFSIYSASNERTYKLHSYALRLSLLKMYFYWNVTISVFIFLLIKVYTRVIWIPFQFAYLSSAKTHMSTKRRRLLKLFNLHTPLSLSLSGLCL